MYREALRQSAVDPTTGRVDVNILTAGVTARTRKLIEQLADAIQTELIPHHGISIAANIVMTQLRQKNFVRVFISFFTSARIVVFQWK